MSTSYNSSNGSSYTGSVRGQNGVISTGGSCEDEEYGDVSSVKKMDAPASTAAYTEQQEQAQEQTNKVNSLCADFNYFICLCVPRASGPGDMAGRLGRWFWGQSDQFISSIIVSISMIPEAISYALIAGLPPSFALQSCWISCMMTAIIGGRPGMITSASGLSALLLYRLINTDTIGATSIMFVPFVVAFAGILQTFSSFFGFGKLATNFPAPMIVGMVNGLAILAFALQFRYAKVFPLTESEMTVSAAAAGDGKAVEVELTIALFAYFGKGLSWIQPWLNFGVYLGEVFLAFIVTMFVPKLTTFFPATIMAMLVVVAVEYGLARQFGADTPLLGDYGGVEVKYPWTTVLDSEYALPSLASWETWKIVTGYGSALFATQFIETAIALNVVNRLDESDGPGFLVLFGQGLSNVLIGFMGGMGSSGVVSMSVLADRTFGTTCLSTFMTGAMLFIFMAWGYPIINYIPLSAISGISIAMACSFIQWRSLVAVFTAFLPNNQRLLLPPQFNVDRLDVCIMLVVTAACLTVDVSALALFCIGVAVSTVMVCRDRGSEESQGQEEIKDIEEEEEVEHVEVVQKQQSIYPSPSGSSGSRSDNHSNHGGCSVNPLDFMCDAAEEAIFPVNGGCV
mmetsp:Transcript_26890/g.41374  ORF Transcript_26890/g.41374 Transcript_26890/m.41374 type:complete len:626 (-) Transcript_26890:113-1990(-)